MDSSDISAAIALFEFSETCQAGGRAELTLAQLKLLDNAGEIAITDMGTAFHHGDSRSGRKGADIRVNLHYLNSIPVAERLASLSLLLVHEATHVAIRFQRLLDELAARQLPIHYFRELSGPGVFNEAADVPGAKRSKGLAAIVKLMPGRMPEFKRQSDALKIDQLLDDTLAIKTYTDESYLDAKFVVAHLGHWGGLSNRRPATKGLFIRALAKSADLHHAVRIVDVMESVRTRADWDAMMANAGLRRRIRDRLDELAANPALSPRIAALERRWQMDLTEDPPERGGKYGARG